MLLVVVCCCVLSLCAVVLCCVVQVFMVSDQALLDEGLVRAMLHSGHSRVPVYRWVAGSVAVSIFQGFQNPRGKHPWRPSSCSFLVVLLLYWVEEAPTRCHLGASLNLLTAENCAHPESPHFG